MFIDLFIWCFPGVSDVWCLLTAPHAASVALHGPDAGHEHDSAPPAVPAGVLHGDGLRLVGRPAARPAHHGAQPGGEAARGVHEAEPGAAAGQLTLE